MSCNSVSLAPKGPGDSNKMDFFREAFNLIQLPAIVTDKFGTILAANKAALKILNCASSQDCNGAPFHQYFKEDRIKVLGFSPEQPKKGEGGYANIWGKNKGIGIRVSDEKKFSFSHSDFTYGNQTYYIHQIIKSIKKQKQSKEKRSKKSKYSTAFNCNHADDLFLVLNRKGEIQGANKAAENFFGSFLQGKQLADYAAKNSKQDLIKTLSLMGENKSDTCTLDFKVKNDKNNPAEKKWGMYELSLASYKGKENLIQVVARNVSKRMDEERSLSKEVEDFYSTLYLGYFSHSISNGLIPLIHYNNELKERVSNILNKSSDRISEKAEMDKSFELVEYVEAYLEQMRTTLDTIQSMSLLDHELFALKNGEFCLRTEIERLMKITEKFAGSQEVRFTYGIPDDIPKFFYGDIARLRLVILNLINNAFQFTSKGGQVNFFLELEEIDDSLFWIKGRIGDTGSGIKEEDKKKLFKRFFHLDEELSKKATSHRPGIGLYISQMIATLMNGKISCVSSNPGFGSVFTFEVQMKMICKISKTERNFDGGMFFHDLYRPKQLQMQEVRVLAAEDNQAVSKILEKVIIRQGISEQKLKMVQNGREAVEAYREALEKKEPYDIFLTDLGMPVMTGQEAVKEIRELEKSKEGLHSTIIACTGNITLQGQQECWEAGMDGYLSKPINPKKIEQCFKHFLDPDAPDSPPQIELQDHDTQNKSTPRKLSLSQILIQGTKIQKKRDQRRASTGSECCNGTLESILAEAAVNLADSCKPSSTSPF